MIKTNITNQDRLNITNLTIDWYKTYEKLSYEYPNSNTITEIKEWFKSLLFMIPTKSTQTFKGFFHTLKHDLPRSKNPLVKSTFETFYNIVKCELWKPSK